MNVNTLDRRINSRIRSYSLSASAFVKNRTAYSGSFKNCFWNKNTFYVAVNSVLRQNPPYDFFGCSTIAIFSHSLYVKHRFVFKYSPSLVKFKSVMQIGNPEYSPSIKSCAFWNMLPAKDLFWRRMVSLFCLYYSFIITLRIVGKCLWTSRRLPCKLPPCNLLTTKAIARRFSVLYKEYIFMTSLTLRLAENPANTKYTSFPRNSLRI